jgi:hypothetical protein
MKSVSLTGLILFGMLVVSSKSFAVTREDDPQGAGLMSIVTISPTDHPYAKIEPLAGHEPSLKYVTKFTHVVEVYYDGKNDMGNQLGYSIACSAEDCRGTLEEIQNYLSAGKTLKLHYREQFFKSYEAVDSSWTTKLMGSMTSVFATKPPAEADSAAGYSGTAAEAKVGIPPGGAYSGIGGSVGGIAPTGYQNVSGDGR